MDEKQKKEEIKQTEEKTKKVEKEDKATRAEQKEKTEKFERVDQVDKTEKKKKEDKSPKEKETKKKSKVGTAIKTILLAILILLAFYIVCTFSQWSLLCKIYDSNTEFDAGNNYKVIMKYGGKTESTTVKIYKDGVGVFQLGNSGYIWVNDKSAYIIIKDLKQYIKLEKGSPASEMDTTASIATYEVFVDKEKTDLFREVLLGKVQIKTGEYKGKECYLVSTDTENVWIDKESKLIVRDEIEGEYKEITIEQNTVTDREVALPDLSNYTNLN